jgi:hypothetical protein
MKISPSNSHTHCQAAQANAQNQAWQRVCLSNRTTKTTDKQTDEKEHRSDNRRLAQWRVQWLIEDSTSHQLLWCIDSIVLRNPPLRQAPNRCASAKKRKRLKKLKRNEVAIFGNFLYL